MTSTYTQQVYTMEEHLIVAANLLTMTKDLRAWLKVNGNPHWLVIVKQDEVEVYEGTMGVSETNDDG